MNHSGTHFQGFSDNKSPLEVLTKPESRTKFTDMESVLHAQIHQRHQAGFFQNPGTPIDKDQYMKSMLGWAQISAPEFLPKIPRDCLPFALVFPSTFISCKDQIRIINKQRPDQVEYNQFSEIITVKTADRTFTISLDPCEMKRCLGTNQPYYPYLIFGPLNLEDLQRRIKKFSPEEILAIIFHCTNVLE